MTRFVLAVILVVTSTFVGSNVAAAASNPSLPQSEASVSSPSAPNAYFAGFRYAENSSHVEHEPVPEFVELA